MMKQFDAFGAPRVRAWRHGLAGLATVALLAMLAACAPAAAPVAPAATTAAPAATTAAPAATAAAPKPTEPPALTATTAAKPTDKPASTATTAPTAVPASGSTVSFAKDIKPIMDKSCVKCHGGEKIEAELKLTSHADVMKGGENGPVVKAGQAAESDFVKLVANGKMPKRAERLSDAQIKLLTDWVNAGAPNN